jgi:hypothetical protein
MPELLWLYLTALLSYRTSASCVALALEPYPMTLITAARSLRCCWPQAT